MGVEWCAREGGSKQATGHGVWYSYLQGGGGVCGLVGCTGHWRFNAIATARKIDLSPPILFSCVCRSSNSSFQSFRLLTTTIALPCVSHAENDFHWCTLILSFVLGSMCARLQTDMILCVLAACNCLVYIGAFQKTKQLYAFRNSEFRFQ